MLDGVAQANILVGDESGKADPVRCMAHSCAVGFSFLLQGALLLPFVVRRD
jgi:hypothetical protein